MNQFLGNLHKGNAYTRNMAASNSSTGSLLLDYFSNMGSYRNRHIEEVFADVSAAFGEDPLNTTKAILYNRMITRRVRGFVETDEIQRGQGNKDESRKAFAWIAFNYPEYFPSLLFLWVSVGYWKDLWDSELAYYLRAEDVYYVVEYGLNNDFHRGLLAKYLPKIRSAKYTKNDRHTYLNAFARGLCEYLGWTEREYRLFKSDPDNTAHLWQRQMSANDWDEIDFNTIPGKALNWAVSQSGRDDYNWIERHDLAQDFMTWLDKQSTVKFTGYPHELYKAAFAKQSMSLMQKVTYDKQFEQLLSYLEITQNVWVALDRSWSMFMESSKVNGVYAGEIADSLAITFSTANTGAFKDHVVMFGSTSKIKKISGSFTDKALQLKNVTPMGSTNFQSVIDEIVRVRQANPEIPIEDYPTVLLVVSDMQFNPTGTVQTNYERAMDKLQAVGLPKITCIWWQVNGHYGEDYASTTDDRGTILLSGFDGSILSQLLGYDFVDKGTGERVGISEVDPHEAMLATLDQEVLNVVEYIVT